MGEQDYIPEPGEPISPGALRTIANWLDTYDRLALTYFSILEEVRVVTTEQLEGARETVNAKTIQNDLRRWADEMEKVK